MKKILFGMMACAALCACTSDDLLSVSNQQGNVANGDVAYMTVRIKDVNSGTRATSGGFAYGSDDEQKVNNAHFYLYKEDGSYYAQGSVGEVDGTASTESTPGTIEWESTTQVAIYGLTDPSVPKMMLTVLNQPEDLVLTNKSLDDATAALAGTPWGNTTDGFMMSTSVYSGTSGIVNYTELDEDDFALEPINIDEDYANGGVDVYVERLAAKVGVTDGMSGSLENNGHVYALSEEELANFPMGAPTPENSNVGGIAIEILGFDVDGVARDAYVGKQIDNSWNFDSWTWNASSNYRSYWAESPNYGDSETEYPTSSNGNTDADEDDASKQLNEYLRYVSLQSPVEIGGTTYCGENTNTTTVIGNEDTDPSMNSLTNVIVKAQLIDYNPNNSSSPKTPIDIIEFHKEYYTVEDFLDKTVADVVDYDFTVLVAEVITSLETAYPDLAGYLEELNDAVIKDNIYVTSAVEDHKVTSNTFSGVSSTLAKFDGSMLSLYNLSDGNVDIFFNGAQPCTGAGTESDPFEKVGQDIIEKYPEDAIVYSGADLDDYEFYFHVDYSKLSTATQLGTSLLGLVVNDGNGNYYLPLDNSFSFTTESTGSTTFWGNHTYTLRNYLLRAITVEADGIDTEFGSYLPNYYKDGLMYYHVPIEHLNSAASDGSITEGEYGVVRNHWYNVTITSMDNLGRGIADEDEVIVPQPELDYYYLGADIDILSWQMVNQTVGW